MNMDNGLIETHIHLEKYPKSERDAMLEEARQGGVEAIVAVSMDMASCERTRELALEYPGFVLPAYGWHPEQPLAEPDELEALIGWIRERHAAGEAFAVGEVGLPYYTRTELEAAGETFDESGYVQILRQFASLAAELDRPLILHAVYEDASKAAAVLREFGVKRAHFHWYKGDAETTRLLAEAGYMISLTPDVLYEPEIQELAAHYPLEQLMTETDGPWPFEGPFAGQATHPLMMRSSIQEIARLRGLGEQETAAALADNARQFYGLE
ncbi:TatD family hydrolase [Paenibacillus pasadenensis]|uniref:TatD family hydrolase n=1 Tax=Paenibacillus pasadenensis TaxID=217090 RepID=UPI00203C3C93|nr:TatD family hydrolase [Paenibacillus pasadenensis]MCM3746077.1 TatD family hydrolase [Paenibacillus pasadenensis]